MTIAEPLPDTVPTFAVEAPGVYDIPADVYHADPVPGGSLSVSGARRLLPPSCPALFRHWVDQGQEHKPAFDFGHAAHRLVLSAGQDIVKVDAADWRTKAAREKRDAAYAAGHIPLLPADHAVVEEMAATLRAHPIAAALFNPDRMWHEQSLFWVDHPTGVWRRARLDAFPKPSSARMVLADYKTSRSAAPEHIEKALHEYGYAQQASWYIAGVEALGLAEQAAFLFVFQEKTPPYLVTVAEPDAMALRIGRDRNRRGLDIYAECVATGRWPGYSDDVELIGLPAWVERRHLAEEDDL